MKCGLLMDVIAILPVPECSNNQNNAFNQGRQTWHCLTDKYIGGYEVGADSAKQCDELGRMVVTSGKR
jgi:Ser/Thr protein kinase RdoA (MazF antagonist)